MCFNQETSLAAFLLGIGSSVYLFYRGKTQGTKEDIIAAWLSILLVSMQLLEFFLWRNQKCDQVNRNLSLLIVVILWLQPFLYYWVCYYYDGSLPASRKISDRILLLFWCLLAFVFFYINYERKDLCSLKDKKSCRLTWDPMIYIYKTHFWLFLITAIMYIWMFRLYPLKSDKQYLLTGRVSLLSLLFAILLSIYLKGPDFTGIMGSIYCFIGAFWGFFRIFGL